MSTVQHVALLPRDGLFCKDGRGWHTSTSGRGYGLDWPWPSTVLGALQTAWGRAEEARTGRTFGPQDWLQGTEGIHLGSTMVLRRSHGTEWRFEDSLWPAPADALLLEDPPEVYRIEPCPPTIPTLGRDDNEAREALWRPLLPDTRKSQPLPQTWRSREFVTWLKGEPVGVRDIEHSFVIQKRLQVHVGIDPERHAAREGVVFSHDVIETLERGAEWAIGAEIAIPDSSLTGFVTLGSDSRLARIESLSDQVFEPPVSLFEAFGTSSRGLRVIAVTPLCFSRGWLPDGFEVRDNEYFGRLPGLEVDLVLRAAFVPRPIHVSGWDMAANGGKGAPKPTTRMVAPGAVYFFECANGGSFGEADARSLWLAAVGARTQEGFGRVVAGVWNSV